MKKVLITGFDPFGGEKINPALESIKKLDGFSSNDFCTYIKEIPTVFFSSIKALTHTLEEIQPDIVILVGQAGGRSDLSIERVAININDARIPDNDGNQPIDTEVVINGPVAYWSGLPIKAIVSNLNKNGIPSSISHAAGTFVCNHLFYGLMHYINQKNASIQGGFIHIPFLPEQIAENPGKPSMSLGTIVSGLKLAIETTVALEKDIVEVGGNIC